MAVPNINVSLNKNWLRLVLLIDYGGKALCCDALFNKENWPTNGVELYKKLKAYEKKICQFQSQRKILLPPSGLTDYNKFDLTLFTSVISNIFGKTYKSLVEDLRLARNQEYHRANKVLSDPEFKVLWKDTKDMLKKYGFDITKVNDFDDSFLDQRLKDMGIFKGR